MPELGTAQPPVVLYSGRIYRCAPFFSIIATLMFETLWPGRLKLYLVDFERCLCVTYPLCSLNLSWSDLYDSPTSCFLHAGDVIYDEYMMKLNTI